MIHKIPKIAFGSDDEVEEVIIRWHGQLQRYIYVHEYLKPFLAPTPKDLMILKETAKLTTSMHYFVYGVAVWFSTHCPRCSLLQS